MHRLRAAVGCLARHGARVTTTAADHRARDTEDAVDRARGRTDRTADDTTDRAGRAIPRHGAVLRPTD